jgi:hypothetical protein
MMWRTALMLAVLILAGGWAAVETVAPANVLDMLRLFSLC